MGTSRLLYSIVCRKFSCTMSQSYAVICLCVGALNYRSSEPEDFIHYACAYYPRFVFLTTTFSIFSCVDHSFAVFRNKSYKSGRTEYDSAIFRSNLKQEWYLVRKKQNGEFKGFPLRLWESGWNTQLLAIKRCLPFSKPLKHHFQPIAKRNLKQCPKGLLKLICCMRFFAGSAQPYRIKRRRDLLVSNERFHEF